MIYAKQVKLELTAVDGSGPTLVACISTLKFDGHLRAMKEWSGAQYKSAFGQCFGSHMPIGLSKEGEIAAAKALKACLLLMSCFMFMVNKTPSYLTPFQIQLLLLS